MEALGEGRAASEKLKLRVKELGAETFLVLEGLWTKRNETADWGSENGRWKKANLPETKEKK